MPNPLIFVTAFGLAARAASDLPIEPILEVDPIFSDHGTKYIIPLGGKVSIPKSMLPAIVSYTFRTTGVHDPDPVRIECNTDLNEDGDCGTDTDLEAFFAALASGDGIPGGGSADYNQDGEIGTDADIEAFFRALGGG